MPTYFKKFVPGAGTVCHVQEIPLLRELSLPFAITKDCLVGELGTPEVVPLVHISAWLGAPSGSMRVSKSPMIFASIGESRSTITSIIDLVVDVNCSLWALLNYEAVIWNGERMTFPDLVKWVLPPAQPILHDLDMKKVVLTEGDRECIMAVVNELMKREVKGE